MYANLSSWVDYFNEIMYNNNYTISTSINQSKIEFTPPLWKQILWCIFYIVMVVVATGGNVIVIWIILLNKRMRTVTNYFLLNLSVADTMVSTLNVIFNFIYMLYSHWPFGLVYCKITQFVAVLSICASVFSLMAISIDRYMAIITPLKKRLGQRCTLIVILWTWILGVLVGLPNVLFFRTEQLQNSTRISCYMLWPDGDTNASSLEYHYNISVTVCIYVVPVVAMIFTYSRISAVLWGSQCIGENTDRQMEIIKNKRKVVKMMMVVVTIFAVCWLPYHVYFLVTFYYPSLLFSPYIQDLYLFIYWLAMSNSMYNPIIYCWMNARFRRGFARAFSFLPFVNFNRTQAHRSSSKYTVSSFYGSESSGHRNIFRRNT
ncbi:unnamed protein product [Psylliodes chrysocephalus]|uniref:G-protein coupled receptors family 1 profile domain-containing protein n=1 Tax=Psylliodes chrysocephalus TaxID=3402493 RepID=A0A9P0CF42_9CUCU|nr:unnamed protein product [Psylliodes chrysocephala]